LKKIAEGNPDEDKIGFFGVGFYSLFSICEEPVIVSGNQCMMFTWKGDQLFTKRAEITLQMTDFIANVIQSPVQPDFTYFVLSLRDPCELPDKDDFGRFLVTSLLFTKNLYQLDFCSNANALLSIQKKMSPPEILESTKYSHINTFTPNKLFVLNEILLQTVQFDVFKSFSSAKKSTLSSFLKFANIDLSEEFEKPGTFNLFVRIANASFKSRLPNDVIQKMERTTKKKPPSMMNLQITFSNFDEFNASSVKNPLFKQVIVFPNQGSVFIGFSTHQVILVCYFNIDYRGPNTFGCTVNTHCGKRNHRFC
jgi:hypothetical protein